MRYKLMQIQAASIFLNCLDLLLLISLTRANIQHFYVFSNSLNPFWPGIRFPRVRFQECSPNTVIAIFTKTHHVYGLWVESPKRSYNKYIILFLGLQKIDIKEIVRLHTFAWFLLVFRNLNEALIERQIMTAKNGTKQQTKLSVTFNN